MIKDVQEVVLFFFVVPVDSDQFRLGQIDQILMADQRRVGAAAEIDGQILGAVVEKEPAPEFFHQTQGFPGQQQSGPHLSTAAGGSADQRKSVPLF